MSEIQAAGFLHGVLGAVPGGKVRTESQSDGGFRVRRVGVEIRMQVETTALRSHPAHTSPCSSTVAVRALGPHGKV